jgi:hypothetical protein
MARWLLLNHVIIDGAFMAAAREIDDLHTDIARIQSAGGVLLKLPTSPVVEARARHVRLQQSKGLREAELDVLTAAFAEYINTGGTGEVVSAILLGTIDGVNLSFTTPQKFVGGTLRQHFNGVRVYEPDDYAASESGGAGTGYDTVTFVAGLIPKIGDRLLADYRVL